MDEGESPMQVDLEQTASQVKYVESSHQRLPRQHSDQFSHMDYASSSARHESMLQAPSGHGDDSVIYGELIVLG